MTLIALLNEVQAKAYADALVEAALAVERVKTQRLQEFVRQIARMTKKGDIIDGAPYSPEEIDEEVEALYSLIGTARELTGDAPSGLEEEG